MRRRNNRKTELQQQCHNQLSILCSCRHPNCTDYNAQAVDITLLAKLINETKLNARMEGFQLAGSNRQTQSYMLPLINFSASR